MSGPIFEEKVTLELNFQYPVLANFKKQLLIAFVIGLWLFLFLFFAEPFKIDRFSFSKKLIVLPIYGLIQTLIISLGLVYQHWVLSREKKWKLSNELVYLVIVILLAWMINYSYYIFFVTSGENTYSFINHARYHFFPALLIVLPVIILSRFLAGYFTRSKEPVDESIVFTGTGSQDFLRIDKNKLVYVAAEGNYIKVYFVSERGLENQLIRSKMSSLSSLQFLWQVHRSFYVNPFHIRKYYFANKNLIIVLTSNAEIPVSRSKKKEVLSLINSTIL